MSNEDTRHIIKHKFHDMFLDMIDNAPMSIVIANSQARIEYVNSHFSELTGYAFEEALGNNPRILQSGQTPREVYQDLWQRLPRGESWKGEFINLKKNGDMYVEIASIFPIKDREGDVYFVAFKIDGTEQKKMQEQINLDPLTTLFNRFYLNERLQADLDTSFALNRPLSLIFLDLDHFKQVNDRHGHPAGDRVLRTVGKMLRQNIRSHDGWIARFGGDEFVICLPGIGADIAYTIAERLRGVFERTPIKGDGRELRLTCSIGVHTITRNDEKKSAEDLIKTVDQKMYMAKKSGRNMVVSEPLTTE